MILSQLKIDSFRGMSGVSLERLAPVSLVVGANNAGKSSVLEASALLLRPFDPTQWVQVARQRDIDMGLVDGLWSLFPSDVSLQVDDGPKQTKPLRVEGTIGGSPRKLTASGLASLNFDTEETEDLTLRVEARVVEVGNPKLHTMEFRRESPAQFGVGITFYRCFTVTPATHRSTRQLVEHLSKAIDEGKKDLAVDLLRLFDPKIQGLDVSASRGRDGVRVTHESRGVVDLASFGDGMRRSAALALALVRSHGGMLLVDEIEAGIHPRILSAVLSKLIQAAEKAEVQILATTHSLEAIDAFLAASVDRKEFVAAYYLQRENGTTLVRRYSGNELSSLRETGLDLR
jgi:predicted ATPase